MTNTGYPPSKRFTKLIVSLSLRLLRRWQHLSTIIHFVFKAAPYRFIDARALMTRALVILHVLTRKGFSETYAVSKAKISKINRRFFRVSLGEFFSKTLQSFRY